MKRVAMCAAVALVSLPLFAQFSTSSGNTTTSDKVGIGTTTPGGNLDISTGASTTRFVLSGAEYYQSANTSTSGVAFLLGINRTQNRQLWIADSARTAVSSSNPVLRIGIFDTYAMVDAIGTDVTTKKLLVVGNAGNVELATGGGKVGIGTNAPSSILHLKAASSALDLTLDGGSTTGSRILQPNAAPMTFTIAGATGDFTFNAGSSAERMRIKSDGKVGIGTTTPGALLHVSGVAAGISPYLIIDRPATTADGAVVFQTNSTFTGQWLFGKAGALNTEDLAIGYNSFVGTNLRMVFTAGGNVGIGRSAPTAALDVNGAIKGNSHLGFLPWVNVASTSTTGYVRLLTPIVSTETNVFSLHIVGSRSSASEAIDIRCTGNAISGTGLAQAGCTVLGTNAPVQITTETVSGTSYVVVKIGAATTVAATGVTATTWLNDLFSVEYEGQQSHDASGFAWSVASTLDPATLNNVSIRNSGGGAVVIGLPTAAGSPDQTERLTVHGSVTVDGNIGAKYQDVAEWVPVATKLSPGTVVIVSPNKRNEVMASTHAYDTAIAGVVSAQPGLILGEGSDSKAQIATTGRVKVHVDATKHAVKAGDLLVTGVKPGTAMFSEPVDLGGIKLHRPGTLVGKALEPLESGEGDILVLLSLQ